MGNQEIVGVLQMWGLIVLIFVLGWSVAVLSRMFWDNYYNKRGR